MRPMKVFNGRIIFDHLPKTAGTAVSSWFRKNLGEACVIDNLERPHLELIKEYGWSHSVICGHLHFNGDLLDPMYQYITLFRDPIDRVISWIFFVLSSCSEGNTPYWARSVYSACDDFIKTSGQKADKNLLKYISNLYTYHFYSINHVFSDFNLSLGSVGKAMDVVKSYNIVGLYEEMPEFLADVADLIGIPAPKSIARVNVTKSRPSVDRISPELRQRIIELNQLDIRLYEEVVNWKKSQPAKERHPVTVSRWKKYDIPPRTHDSERVFTTPDVSGVRAAIQEGSVLPRGNVMTFEVDFTLNRPIEHELESGIHIYDGDKKLAYGSNSVLMGKKFCALSAGAYRMTHYVAADLPAGRYTAGFAFAEKGPDEVKQMAWHGQLCSFEVTHDSGGMSIGYVSLPSEMTMESV